MIEKIFTRSIRAICVVGMALSMTMAMAMAMAQDASVVLQHTTAADGEHLIVVSYSDPETEVGNGTNPPDPNLIDPETDVASETDRSIEVYNFPESEVGNGIDPPL